MNLLQKIDMKLRQQLTEAFPIPEFRAGDTIRVFIPRKVLKAVAKSKKMEEVIYNEKIEGVCISRTSRGMGSNVNIKRNDMNANITVPLYGVKIEVLRYGRVRRAKIYYFNKLTGKKARIRERNTFGKK